MASILTDVNIPNFCFDVDNVSKRGSTKLIHETVSINGQSGADGHSGINSISEIPKSCSSIYYNYGRGRDGENGAAGQPGQPGQPDTDSQHALVQLNGKVENLNMELTTFQTLYNSSEYSSGINWNLARSLDTKHNSVLFAV